MTDIPDKQLKILYDFGQGKYGDQKTKGLKVADKKLAALFQAREQQLLTELLDFLPPKDALRDNYTTSVMAWHEGWNDALDHVVAVIKQRMGSNGDSE